MPSEMWLKSDNIKNILYVLLFIVVNSYLFQ